MMRPLLVLMLCLTPAPLFMWGWSQGASDASIAPLDQVWIEPPPQPENSWYPNAIRHVRLRVTEFGPKLLTGQRDANSVAQQWPAERVVWIQPGEMSEFESRGLQLFEAGKHGEALPVLIDAIGKRPPVWRQQWLSMVAAQAAWRSGRAEIALELVTQIDRLPFPPLVLSWMPIHWGTSPVPANAVAAAESRLLGASPAVQLVAASWLLPRRPGQSTQVLRILAASEENPHIASLAKILLRRTAPPDEVRDRGARWKREIETLPMVLQVGPTVLLMNKYRAAGESAQAASLRLSLELTAPHPHPELQDGEEGF